MTQASASPPKSTKPKAHDLSIADAKRQMIDAFYHASPARIVEKHPWLSVTAAASAALAATVVVQAPLGRKVLSTGLMQAIRSALPLVQTLAAQKFAAHQAAASAPTDSPDSPHAMG